MNKKDRLKKVVLAAFDKDKITSEAVSQCSEAIQNVMDKITVIWEKELIGEIPQRYFIREIEKRDELEIEAIIAYVNFLVDNLSQIEAALRKRGYEGKIVKIDLVKKHTPLHGYLLYVQSILRDM